MFGFGNREKAQKAEQEKMRDKVREWQRELRKEARVIDRQVREINREIDKLKAQAKELAKKGDQVANVRTLAKHVAKARSSVLRLETMKVNLNSIAMQLQEQYATVRIVGVMDKSSAMMKTMMKVMKAPELMGTMTKMKMEMEKAGIIQDIMDDSLDAAMPVDEEEIDDVVEQVLFELTAGAMGTAPPTAAPNRLEEMIEEEKKKNAAVSAL